MDTDVQDECKKDELMTRAEYLLQLAVDEGAMDKAADKVGDIVGSKHVGKHAGRGGGKALRNTISVANYGADLPGRGIVKGFTRARHDAGGHMKKYRAEKRDIKSKHGAFTK